ncbi:MAG: hypothetical protein QXO94_05745 [Candidatus Bathyarchaeia archaeon]
MDRLLKDLKEKGIFKRNRFSLRKKLRIRLLYMAALSYTHIAYLCQVLRRDDPCSHMEIVLSMGSHRP